MNKRDIVRTRTNRVNEIYQKMISEKGINKFLKEGRESIKKNSIPLIKESFEFLKKDIRLAPKVGIDSKESKQLIETIERNKNNLSIFEIEDDELEYQIEFPIIPFNRFYIATNVCERIKEDLYSINGFFVIDFDEDYLLIIYKWDRHPSDGWGINSFLMRKKGLTNNYDENKSGTNVPVGELKKQINLLAMRKFDNLMKKLIYKINKKEYNSYKKYSYGNYIEKKIIFSYDVRSHKRHFWKDSGRFKIPFLSNEELTKKGYGVDELVVKDGRLKMNIPFKIIGEFSIGEKEIEENKVYDMIEKRHFKSEEKLFKILRELYPDNYIKRHDRKTLKGLELDFFIRDLKLAFEFDGHQHYEFPNAFHKTKEEFEAQKQRDRKKTNWCKKKRIRLVRIKENENLNKTLVKKKIKQVLSNPF